MKETSAITGGKLDYLIANAAKVSDSSSFQAIGDLYVLYPEVLLGILGKGLTAIFRTVTQPS